MTDERDALFSVPKPISQVSRQLNPRSTLSEASAEFERHMQQQALSENTIKAFRYDLNILSEYLGKRRALGEISLDDLQKFVQWLRHERGVPCNVKSLARRITTLKVFFGWLAESAVLPADPADALIQVQFTTPLPEVLYDEQVEQLLAATHMLRRAARPDARPHLLVSLLLATGIKKGECMAIVLNHLDLSEQPAAVWIRYANPRYRLKERKLKLDPAWPGVLEEYKAQYAITDKLFPCTARNLEYVLADAGQVAHINRPVSFEALRWTCAVRDYKDGMASGELRRKLGLSEITWRQAAAKLAQLAAPAL